MCVSPFFSVGGGIFRGVPKTFQRVMFTDGVPHENLHGSAQQGKASSHARVSIP